MGTTLDQINRLVNYYLRILHNTLHLQESSCGRSVAAHARRRVWRDWLL